MPLLPPAAVLPVTAALLSVVPTLLPWPAPAPPAGPRPAPATLPAGETVTSAGVWPLQPAPEVVHPFAPPVTRYGPGHRGVDLAGREGQVVRAARAGVVTYAGRVAGRGVVVVSHGETRTTYEPVSATVGVGERVPAGRPLGRLERFGSHCWPAACLHWGLLRGAVYLDPLTLVGAGPVRLLPWAWSPAAALGVMPRGG